VLAGMAGAAVASAIRVPAFAKPAGADLAFVSAGEAAAAIRRRTVSSAELTQLMLERIERFNPKLNAVPSEPQGQRRLATSAGARPYLDLIFWNTFATLAGLPSTAAPVGHTRQGLPVGIQIIGPYLEDATPIDFAARMAEVLGGFASPAAYL
jgi:amidase